MEYIKTAHSVYYLQYHVVWVCKYRCRILNPGIKGSSLRLTLAFFHQAPNHNKQKSSALPRENQSFSVYKTSFTPTAESHGFSPDPLWSGLWSGCRATKSRRSRSESAKLSGATGLPVGLHRTRNPWWGRRRKIQLRLIRHINLSS